MYAFFFDSSGIVKRYVNEVGTPWVLGVTDPAAGNHIYVARITGVEVVSGITRRQRAGSLTATQASSMIAQFRHEFATNHRVIEVTPALITAAMSLAETHALRAYDAVQLAAAIEVNTQSIAAGTTMTLISADTPLNAAALAEGLTVDDPNAH